MTSPTTTTRISVRHSLYHKGAADVMDNGFMLPTHDNQEEKMCLFADFRKVSKSLMNY